MQYSVLIIGAGKIGAFFDTPESSEVLTHAHAFSEHPGFHLLGFVDADKEQAKNASRVWGGKGYSSVAEAFAHHAVDVAVVAVPDEMHYPLLKELLDYQLKLVFAEKPLTTMLADSETIVGLYREHNIRLAVNYSRRFVPEFVRLRDEIASGTFGGYLAGSGYYGKGTLHNGSHMLDLLRFLLGEVTNTQAVSSIHDHYDDDPSCTALLTLANGGKFYLQAMDSRCFTVFEIDLFFEHRRIRMVDSGSKIETYEVRDNDLFKGYRNLCPTKACKTGLESAIKFAAERIYAHLCMGESLPCTGDDGIAAHKVCSSILDSLK